ncbi:hypothetical protein L873DRAFT_1759525 [Choiromyces venosus 120613-1]|uniref:C2 NT-type domain-containing protein n=1 Tax=Choiromyces venosus 120613-1 TaxID=1336337 RepID=A0A3N4K4H3_9PEZI|nr:hypothetical protein L873DRAFT_1759525 [Choiromyces venosus 120613-1]
MQSFGMPSSFSILFPPSTSTEQTATTFPMSRPTPSSTFSSTSSSSSSLRRGVLTRDLSFDDIIVPKNRRPKFDLTLEIHDLNNVPLVSGQAFVKWHIGGTTRADFRGRTNKENIKEHKVNWHYAQVCSNIRMTVDRSGMLQELPIVFEIIQEYAGARERIALGSVTLNLAEYTRVHKETRRYLMQDSKINSTLKVSISLDQVGGESNFESPMLRGAQVFGGIAGIIGESQNQEDTGNVTVATSQKRETSAIQDMYRCTLAASWQLQAGELHPEECIEDIFAGGDGWTPRSERGRVGKAKSVRYEGVLSRGGKGSDSDSLSAVSAGAASGTSSSTSHAVMQGHVNTKDARRRKDGDTLSIMSNLTGSKVERKQSSRSTRSARSAYEMDELRAREDLVSWRMPSVV